MTQAVTIRLPLPSSDLTAQRNVGHWAKASATKRHRAWARLAALKHRGVHMPRARITYRFYFPDRRARDTANYIYRCKPYVDGIVDAGLIPDDKWTVLELGQPVVGVDRSDPRVELVLEPIAAETAA